MMIMMMILKRIKKAIRFPGEFGLELRTIFSLWLELQTISSLSLSLSPSPSLPPSLSLTQDISNRKGKTSLAKNL